MKSREELFFTAKEMPLCFLPVYDCNSMYLHMLNLHEFTRLPGTNKQNEFYCLVCESIKLLLHCRNWCSSPLNSCSLRTYPLQQLHWCDSRKLVDPAYLPDAGELTFSQFSGRCCNDCSRSCWFESFRILQYWLTECICEVKTSSIHFENPLYPFQGCWSNPATSRANVGYTLNISPVCYRISY